MFAVLRNALPVTRSHYAGKVESRHRTAAAAVKAAAKAQAGCKRANGSHTFLDLTVGEIEHEDRDSGTARVATDTDAMRAAHD